MRSKVQFEELINKLEKILERLDKMEQDCLFIEELSDETSVSSLFLLRDIKDKQKAVIEIIKNVKKEIEYLGDKNEQR